MGIMEGEHFVAEPHECLDRRQSVLLCPANEGRRLAGPEGLIDPTAAPQGLEVSLDRFGLTIGIPPASIPGTARRMVSPHFLIHLNTLSQVSMAHCAAEKLTDNG
jgi:hypothetical protein